MNNEMIELIKSKIDDTHEYYFECLDDASTNA